MLPGAPEPGPTHGSRCYVPTGPIDGDVDLRSDALNGALSRSGSRTSEPAFHAEETCGARQRLKGFLDIVASGDSPEVPQFRVNIREWFRKSWSGGASSSDPANQPSRPRRKDDGLHNTDNQDPAPTPALAPADEPQTRAARWAIKCDQRLN